MWPVAVFGTNFLQSLFLLETLNEFKVVKMNLLEMVWTPMSVLGTTWCVVVKDEHTRERERQLKTDAEICYQEISAAFSMPAKHHWHL